MRRIIQIIIIGTLIALCTSWLVAQQGVTRLDWLGYRLEVPTSALVAAFALVFILVIILDRSWRALRLWPKLLGAGWANRRRLQGDKALGLGLVALAAGDLRSARRQARKAERLLGRGVLPDLLAAQSAHALGDATVALRYFTALAAQKETAYFGQLGLMQLHQGKQDTRAALLSARKALALQPDSRAAGQHVLLHEVAAKNWPAASAALQALLSDHYLSEAQKARCTRQLACLSWLQGEAALGAQKETYLTQSLRYDAGFLPAILSKAALDADAEAGTGQKKRSLKMLEKQFLRQPHPDLAVLIEAASGDNSGQLIARLTRLAVRSQQPAEARLVAAKAAITHAIWASASSLLSQIAPEDHTNEYFLMQADLASIAEQPEAAAAAMVSAAHAPHGPAWRCSDCQTITPQFFGTCPSCETLAGLDWCQSHKKSLQIK